MKYLNIEKEEIRYKNAPLAVVGFFKNNEEVDNFISGLSRLKKN